LNPMRNCRDVCVLFWTLFRPLASLSQQENCSFKVENYEA
jgi:hypothetical protein